MVANAQLRLRADRRRKTEPPRVASWKRSLAQFLALQL